VMLIFAFTVSVEHTEHTIIHVRGVVDSLRRTKTNGV